MKHPLVKYSDLCQYPGRHWLRWGLAQPTSIGLSIQTMVIDCHCFWKKKEYIYIFTILYMLSCRKMTKSTSIIDIRQILLLNLPLSFSQHPVFLHSEHPALFFPNNRHFLFRTSQQFPLRTSGIFNSELPAFSLRTSGLFKETDVRNGHQTPISVRKKWDEKGLPHISQSTANAILCNNNDKILRCTPIVLPTGSTVNYLDFIVGQNCVGCTPTKGEKAKFPYSRVLPVLPGYVVAILQNF